MNRPRVAIVHDYLVNKGGAEKVVLAMHRAYPAAPIFTALYHPTTTFGEFVGADVRTSFLQRFSRNPSEFRRFLPLFGRAMESLKIEGFDVVLASSAGFGHFVRPRGARLICYCHTPPRFLWDARYDVSGMTPRWARPVAPAMLALLRRADKRAARRVHTYVANSTGTQRRIAEVYGRRSIVINPPVETDRFTVGAQPGEHHLMVGRLLAHRNMHLAIEAFTRMARPLVVVGDGPIAADLRTIAGPTITFAGAIDDAALTDLYQRARALVITEEADFGIAPLEANAAGRPVVALRKGGVLETIVDGFNGVFFDEETVDALIAAVERADTLRFDAAALRTHAERFSEKVFAAHIRELVEHVVADRTAETEA